MTYGYSPHDLRSHGPGGLHSLTKKEQPYAQGHLVQTSTVLPYDLAYHSGIA